MGKFHGAQIFTDGQSLPFCGCVHSRPLCSVQSSLFRRFNFYGLFMQALTGIKKFPLGVVIVSMFGE